MANRKSLESVLGGGIIWGIVYFAVRVSPGVATVLEEQRLTLHQYFENPVYIISVSEMQIQTLLLMVFLNLLRFCVDLL